MSKRIVLLTLFLLFGIMLIAPRKTTQAAAPTWITWFQTPSTSGWVQWGRHSYVAHNAYSGGHFTYSFQPTTGSYGNWWTRSYSDSWWNASAYGHWWPSWPSYDYDPIPQIGPYALKYDTGSRDGSVYLHRAWFYLSVPAGQQVTKFEITAFSDNNSLFYLNDTYILFAGSGSRVYPVSPAPVIANGWNLLAVATYNDVQYGGYPNCCNPHGLQYLGRVYVEDAPVDLSVVKTDNPDPVEVGNDVSYTLTVSNRHTTGTAQNVRVTDNIPAGVNFISASGSGYACTYSSPDRRVTCTRPSLGPSATTAINVTVNVPQSFSAPSIYNEAAVTNDVADSNLNNNTNGEWTTVRLGADMQITKTDNPDPVPVGSNLAYTLSVRNNGPGQGVNVVVADTIPAGLAYVSASGSGFSCSYNNSNRKVTCSRSGLASGATASITLLVNVPENFTASSITNTATVSNDRRDFNLSNNTSTATTAVQKIADLAITKADSPDPVLAGDSLQYTLTARNHGPSQAQNVSMTDVLPAGLVYNNVFAPSGWSCSYDASSRAITCSASTMAAGATANITLVVGVPSGYAASSISNAANVTSATPDPNLADNSATETTAVIKQADLSLEKSDNPDPVSAGENLRYTLSVGNLGPSDAVNVRVVDTLPAGLTFVNVTPPTGWSCSYDALARSVVCTAPTLAAGAAATILLDTAVPSGYAGGETIRNTAAVTSDTPDPDPANNSDTEETTINMAWGLTPPTGHLFAHVKVSGEMQPGEQDQNDYLADTFIPYHLQVPVGVGLGFHKETSPILCTTTVAPCPAENTIQGTVMVESFSISAVESLQTGDVWVFDSSAVTLNRYAEPSLSNCTLGRCIAYGSFTSPRYEWLDPAEYIYLYWQHPSGQPLDCQEGYQCWNIPQVEPGYYAVRGNVTIVVDFPGYPQVQRAYTLPGTANFEIVASFAQPALP